MDETRRKTIATVSQACIALATVVGLTGVGIDHVVAQANEVKTVKDDVRTLTRDVAAMKANQKAILEALQKQQDLLVALQKKKAEESQ